MREGDLCSVRTGDGGYVVGKILKLEEGVVHVRLYAKRYDDRPQDVADDELTLGTVHDEQFGLGHLPLDASAFASWKPELIRHTAVDPEELEGYLMWRGDEDEEAGGVWGRSESRYGAGLLARVWRLFKRA